jgi:hypothetical protein
MIGTISSSTAANGILAIATKQSNPKTGSVSSPSSLSVENTTHSSVCGLAPSAVASTGESQTKTDRPRSGVVSGRDLSNKEKAVVRELEMRDREVHAHAQAHAAAGAGIAGAPSYSYETGPDGRRYAVDGEVAIHVRTGSDDPQVAIQQYEQVVRAALAPADPSSHDRAVAANAQTKIAELQARAASERKSKAPGSLANESGAAKNETGTTSADLLKTAAIANSSFAAYRSSQTQQLSSLNVFRGKHISLVA